MNTHQKSSEVVTQHEPKSFARLHQPSVKKKASDTMQFKNLRILREGIKYSASWVQGTVRNKLGTFASLKEAVETIDKNKKIPSKDAVLEVFRLIAERKKWDFDALADNFPQSKNF